MNQGDWDEIMQHPNRPLTNGQLALLGKVNIATLSSERRSAMALRLLIEMRRLMGGHRGPG